MDDRNDGKHSPGNGSTSRSPIDPGDWMIHCHILEHQQAGMMGVIRMMIEEIK